MVVICWIYTLFWLCWYFSSIGGCVVSCTLPLWCYNLVEMSWHILAGNSWTVYGDFGLRVYQLLLLNGIIGEILPICLESSFVIVFALAGLPWLLSMSLKFIACGISGCSSTWWNLCPHCPVGIHIHITGLNFALTRVIWAL